jgi:hypothetical protein
MSPFLAEVNEVLGVCVDFNRRQEEAVEDIVDGYRRGERGIRHIQRGKGRVLKGILGFGSYPESQLVMVRENKKRVNALL